MRGEGRRGLRSRDSRAYKFGNWRLGQRTDARPDQGVLEFPTAKRVESTATNPRSRSRTRALKSPVQPP